MATNDFQASFNPKHDLEPDYKKETTIATTAVHVLQVPAGKTWTIYAVGTWRVQVGSVTINITDSGGNYIQWDVLTSGNRLSSKFSPPITLKPGMEIGVVYGAGTSGLLETLLMYAENDISY